MEPRIPVPCLREGSDSGSLRQGLKTFIALNFTYGKAAGQGPQLRVEVVSVAACQHTVCLIVTDLPRHKPSYILLPLSGLLYILEDIRQANTTILLRTFLLYLLLSVCVWAHTCHAVCWGPKDNLRESVFFFPPTTWVPGIELGSLGLAASTFIC